MSDFEKELDQLATDKKVKKEAARKAQLAASEARRKMMEEAAEKLKVFEEPIKKLEGKLPDLGLERQKNTQESNSSVYLSLKPIDGPSTLITYHGVIQYSETDADFVLHRQVGRDSMRQIQCKISELTEQFAEKTLLEFIRKVAEGVRI